MKSRLDTRVLVLLSLIVGIGAVLHIFAPPIVNGMKPDMLLIMMFLGIILFPKFQYVMLLSLVTGAIAALTTGLPGGQIANLIDKPLTALVAFGIVLAAGKFTNKKVLAASVTLVGTLISGAIFLFVAVNIIGLVEGSFMIMYATIVLPTAAFNTVAMTVIYPIVEKISKRSRIATA
ncbi:tryptophan transporter [Pontibacillus salipaludis]|uniref:Tryptophan transport protein n=1 Tax=Pontibacillus salipaludis TaxID=1697394 RepID=A0ABQ1QG14_9BACI|nr:tryptophan transporter [Pontibacillus salipaludis]GGD23944.1 putative tryptophan transport protein [Pontibacillus salipaludis]